MGGVGGGVTFTDDTWQRCGDIVVCYRQGALMFRAGGWGNGCLRWLWTGRYVTRVTPDHSSRWPCSPDWWLIWPQGCKRGPLLPVPPLHVDPLSFLRAAWSFLGSLTACSVDSDGWADTAGCCTTPPAMPPSTTTTPCAAVLKYRTLRYSPQRQPAA